MDVLSQISLKYQILKIIQMKLNINKFDGRKIGENEEILQINDRTKDISASISCSHWKIQYIGKKINEVSPASIPTSTCDPTTKFVNVWSNDLN